MNSGRGLPIKKNFVEDPPDCVDGRMKHVTIYQLEADEAKRCRGFVTLAFRAEFLGQEFEMYVLFVELLEEVWELKSMNVKR